MTKIIELLASHGYEGMAIDYDLNLAAHFPVALYQCEEAVRWLRAHATQYHIDPQRIAVAGRSAGSELAALLHLRVEIPAMRERVPQRDFPLPLRPPPSRMRPLT
ncbi:MAG TPA: alpha/beta hydrolase [Edaphobacter sp.]